MQADGDKPRVSHTVADATGEEVGCHSAIDVRVVEEALGAAAAAGYWQGVALDAHWGLLEILREG